MAGDKQESWDAAATEWSPAERVDSFDSSIGSGAIGDVLGQDRARQASAVRRRTQRVPNGQTRPYDLSQFQEQRLLGTYKEGKLYALGRAAAYNPQAHPVILIHGIMGSPASLQTIADRITDLPVQLYVFAYESYVFRRTSEDARDLANQLFALSNQHIGAGRSISIIAHSMGGVVAREMYNLVLRSSAGCQKNFGGLDAVAIDSPMEGFDGPSDRQGGNAFPFVPKSMIDMRSESELMIPLSDPELPDNMTLALVYSEGGNVTLDYYKGELAVMPKLLADHINYDKPVDGSPKIRNFWHALRSSQRYIDFFEKMERLSQQGKLDEAAVLVGLKHYFPEFSGGHTSVLNDPRLGRMLRRRILRSIATEQAPPGSAKLAPENECQIPAPKTDWGNPLG